MCWECGGRCVCCGEPSTLVMRCPLLTVYTCAEHVDDAAEYAERTIERIEVAPWN